MTFVGSGDAVSITVMCVVSWHARYKQKQTMFHLIQDQYKQSPPTLSNDLLDPVTRQSRASSAGWTH